MGGVDMAPILPIMGVGLFHQSPFANASGEK